MLSHKLLAGLAIGLLHTSFAVAAEIPRLPDGKPDLNGVWQVLNTANYDLLAHPAKAALSSHRGGTVLPVMLFPAAEDRILRHRLRILTLAAKRLTVGCR